MKDRAADGAAWMAKQLNTGTIVKPSTYSYNGWIGEQATHSVRSWHREKDVNREGRSNNCRKKGGYRSGWGSWRAKQLNTGTLESRHPSIIPTRKNTISLANSWKGVASPPPTYQTNSSTWAAFGGPRFSSKKQTNTGFLGVQLSLSHDRQLTQISNTLD